MFTKALLTLVLSLMPVLSQGSLVSAYRKIKRGDIDQYPRVVKALVKNNLYFTSIPHVKEYLSRTKRVKSREIDKMIDEIITHVGVRQFEVLPVRILERSNAPIIRYILAKKHFRAKKYRRSLEKLNQDFPSNHPVRPYALALKGSILSILGRNRTAMATFHDCVTASKREIRRHDDKNRRRQLSINRDNCIVGIPRTQFAAKQYKAANSTYLDLAKESPIWPEILFEEAWNSFYLEDYNRTLGKLVTYQASILNYIFNPEVDVLKALTYLHLCLYEDAQHTIKKYYEDNESGSLAVSNLLKTRGKDYRYYYMLAKSRINKKPSRDLASNSQDPFLARLLHATIRDPAFMELYDSFRNGRDELEKIKKIKSRTLRRILTDALKESLLLQRDLIGAYVRKKLLLFVGQINKSFEGMSYISLEISKRKKEALYGVKESGERTRGNIKNLMRTSKQYFWTFNGEFWADELGDYAFSLKSQCDQK